MKCPHCGLVITEQKVYDTRKFKNTFKRTRKCNHCLKSFKTYEVMENEFFNDRTPKRNQKLWSDGEIINLVKMRESDLTEKEIAKKLGRTYGSVHRKSQELLESGEYFSILDELEIVFSER